MKTREQWVEEVMEQVEKYGELCEAAENCEYEDQHAAITATRDAYKKLRALLLEVPDPEGYKLLKIEPTEKMHVAAVKAITKCYGNADFPAAVWNAMLAASPEYKGE